MSTAFGEYLRRRRLEKQLGLRQTAKMIGVSPSYLSRLESGDEVNPPSEKVIEKLADVIGENKDSLMLLAGRISKDIKGFVATTPNLADFLRTARDEGYGPHEFARLAKKIRKKSGENDE